MDGSDTVEDGGSRRETISDRRPRRNHPSMSAGLSAKATSRIARLAVCAGLRQKITHPVPKRNNPMKPDLLALRAHADAIDAYVAETIQRNNALIEAQGIIVQYDTSPMRSFTLQGLAKAVVRGQELQAALAPYSRSLRQYLAEVERKEG